jgi:radical SAM protein with 4Fe4S-binding SPASM domain
MPQPSDTMVMNLARTTAYRTGCPITRIVILYEHLNLFGAFVLLYPNHFPGTGNLKKFAIQLYACWVFHTPILSFFPPSHHIPGRPETSEDNAYFRNRTLLPQCTDCSVLNWCRGGCRAVHLTDMKAVELTCKIKQEIINFILRETQNNYRQSYQQNCNHQHENNDL